LFLVIAEDIVSPLFFAIKVAVRQTFACCFYKVNFVYTRSVPNQSAITNKRIS